MDDFNEIYRDSANKVYRFLLKLCRNPDLAEELTQETFYQAYLHIDRFKGECTLDTWLCQIAKNAYFKESRRRKNDRHLDEKAADASDPVKKMEDKSTAMAVYRHLHELGDPYREVFTLHVLGELSFKEIAQISKKSESWAKMTFYRAKAELVKRIEAENGK